MIIMKRIKYELPVQGQAVLTQHEDDLFPVAAYRILGKNGSEYWFRAIEGPEDREASGKDEELYRPPTHWIEIEILQLPKT